MHIPVFYAPPDCRTDELITLPAEESRHAGQILRLKQGNPVIVVDGLGTAVRGEIISPGRTKATLVRVYNEIRNFGEPSVRLTLAAGLSAGYKFDTVVEKGTELGVKRFVPLITESSKVKLDEPRRIAARVRRLEKVALAAMKQCRRSYRPDICPPTGFAGFLKETDSDSLNLIFHPGQISTPFDQLSIDPSQKRVTILIGPESGFTADEFHMAVESGYLPVSLGSRILRTETAGPAVCTLVMNVFGELR